MGKHEIVKQSAVTQDKALRLALFTFGILLSITTIAGVILTNTKVSADNPAHANASVNVSAACTLSGGNNQFSSNVANSETVETSDTARFGNTVPIKATCNDNNGLSIYAIGYSGNTTGGTDLISSTGSNNITTGTSSSAGSNSYWAMKLAPVTGVTHVPIIVGSTEDTEKTSETINWSTYNNVPSSYSKVAYYNSNTDIGSSAVGASITPIYQIHISSTQPAGTYAGKVKYTLIHPNSSTNNNDSLYDTIALISKGKQTVADLQTEIATPTEEAPVSSNSGVFEYDPGTFGLASDAANTHPIYYYRGVLDSYGNTGTRGSNGLSDAYPNYVKLNNNTCWRIVRTTGSGGVKMIYNGAYTNNTCANATTAVQLTTTSPFNTGSATIGETTYSGLGEQNMHAVGYTYSDVAAGTTSATSVSTLFGSSGNDTTTNTNDSIIKQYLESGWYNDNMASYTSMLEPNAGYCNDRTTYPSDSYAKTDQLDESTTVIPYGTTGMTAYYYGAYTRDQNAAQNPSLTCPRGVVDLYSTTTASGGNGQLNYPVALLTTDEVTLAGSGYSGATGSVYHAKSFLRSGSNFWLLSPYNRTASGLTGEFYLNTNGRLSSSSVYRAYGVRPVISLTPGTSITGGNGTATDPWTVE